MADSPTTRNRLRKQEVGAKTNAWGTDWNEDGGSDRLDESLDGVVSFALNAPKTLTSVNYETDEARKRVINVTGGAGDTITIPALEKWYLLRAGSSGDVAVSNGSNSVTVKAGNIVPVFSDGTNVYQARCLDYGSDLLKSTGTPTLGSHLVNKSMLDATAFNAALPNQSGNAGKRVGTDGTTASWSAITSGEVTTALGYTPTSVTSLTGVQSISDFKTGLSLNNVNNTSDANKPISSATQTALDGKLALAGGTMTGGLITVASASGGAGLRLPQGAAPSAPVDGDFWITSGGVFARVGGVTQQLALAGGWTLIDTEASTSGTTVDFTSIPQTYSDLLIVPVGVSGSGAAGVALKISINNGSSYSTATVTLGTFAGGSNVLYGGAEIIGYRLGAGVIVSHAADIADGEIASTNGVVTGFRASSGINAIQLAISAGAFDAGSFLLFGRQ